MCLRGTYHVAYLFIKRLEIISEFFQELSRLLMIGEILTDYIFPKNTLTERSCQNELETKLSEFWKEINEQKALHSIVMLFSNRYDVNPRIFQLNQIDFKLFHTFAKILCQVRNIKGTTTYTYHVLSVSVVYKQTTLKKYSNSLNNWSNVNFVYEIFKIVHNLFLDCESFNTDL
ncbi:Hypothetical_protein [Hexamita inflata]|uniref:Hypothetical_protein n=1 Tax=Hexamita inflata TaxID=28002 RepID=A0AA86UZB5_9EUKA|nr:Hypothetical protein HINF_LOCUS44668 [Hexamita inflata]CAI9970406.1 Hypothetical protein HINF_LOCUS58051 [Hexamita inflata]